MKHSCGCTRSGGGACCGHETGLGKAAGPQRDAGRSCGCTGTGACKGHELGVVSKVPPRSDRGVVKYWPSPEDAGV